jgi:aspartate-semialdehyde dehydrogenase
VAVEHGHTVCLTVGFETAPTAHEAIEALRNWRGNAAVQGLPSAPFPPIEVRDELDRPQPRRDVNNGRGMTISVGRVREDAVMDLRMVAMAHNVVRGAAGGSVLNAEMLLNTGVLDRATGALRVLS